MIIIDDVYKRYKTKDGPGRWILNGVSLTIPPKHNVGLIGKNGAGKSTLLRLIGGVDHPTKGSIVRKTRISWPMGLGSGLQPSLTGRQNSKFICRIYGHESDLMDRISYIQDFAEIGSAFDEPIRTYSSGMKSRLQFALSLAVDFDVYISDEVTAAGDASFRKKAAEAFRNLVGRSSLIMAAHGESTLKEFCKSGIWLHEGKAHWFDDINDALREYKKSELNNEINKAISLDRPHQEYNGLTREMAEAFQQGLTILSRGLNGYPEKIGHEEGNNAIRTAKEIGMNLVNIVVIKNLGFELLPNKTPLLIKYNPSMDKYVELYDLNSQCVKMPTTTQ